MGRIDRPGPEPVDEAVDRRGAADGDDLGGEGPCLLGLVEDQRDRGA